MKQQNSRIIRNLELDENVQLGHFSCKSKLKISWIIEKMTREHNTLFTTNIR